MSEGAASQVDPGLIEKLRSWLAAKIPGASDLRIVDTVEPSQGFSSRTILFRAQWQEQGKSREWPLVARIQRDTVCPMLADVFHQYRVMKALGEHTGAAVPKVVFAEQDANVLGDPFFIMEQVNGRVPGDFPSYHQEGWVAELTDEGRQTLWWNGIRAMEKAHRASWRHFPFIGEPSVTAPDSEPPDARFYLHDFVGRWLDWAAQGQSYPELEEALKFLLDNPPPIKQSGLVWNDARLGNTMYSDDLTVSALFDFEVASLGPPELDMAHWLYLDEVFSTQFGIPRISGIPDRQTTIKGFEDIYGWSMPYFAYYEAAVALKIVILTIRDYSNGKTMNAPEALPGFLMDRLRQYLGEYREYLAGGSPA